MTSWLPHTLCSFKVKYLSHKKSFFFLIDFCMCVCMCTKHIVTLSWWGEWWRSFISDGEAPWVMEKLHGWWGSPQMNNLKHNPQLSIIHNTDVSCFLRWDVSKGYLSEPSYSLPSIITLSKMSERIYFNVLLLKLVGIFYGKVKTLWTLIQPEQSSNIKPISFYLCPRLLFHH